MIILLAGFPKSLTTSAYDYITSDKNIKSISSQLDNALNIKEPSLFSRKDLNNIEKFNNSNYTLIDGTTSYIYNERAYSNINKLKNFEIILLNRKNIERYTSSFKMFHEKSLFNIDFKKLSNEQKFKAEKYLNRVNKKDLNAFELQLISTHEEYLLDNEQSLQKIRLIKNGNIDEFVNFELEQYKTKKFENTFSILPVCISHWAINSFFSSISNLKRVAIINFEDTDQLNIGIKKFFNEIGKKFEPKGKIEYKSVDQHLRIKSKNFSISSKTLRTILLKDEMLIKKICKNIFITKEDFYFKSTIKNKIKYFFDKLKKN